MIRRKIDPHIFRLPSGELKTSLLSQESSTPSLAVVLPGAGYSCKQPLLYFAIELLLSRGFQVLTIDQTYSENTDWLGLKTMESALKVVQEDAFTLFPSIEERFGTKIHTLLGRSLGTYAMASGLNQQLISPTQLIWQTPSLNDQWETLKNCRIKSFAIIGTADERFSVAKEYLPKDTFIVDHADHAMELPNDPIGSIDVLKRVTAAMNEWLLPPNQ